MRELIISLLLIITFSSLGFTQNINQKIVDSLFVIASSGELKYRDLVEPAIDEMAQLGKDIVPLLVDKFTTKSARERLTIINILKKIGKDAVPYLIYSLKNPNGLIVQRVCWALGDIKDSSAVDALIDIRGHHRWQVRDQALGALGKIQDNKADDAILFGFGDDIGQVRKAVAVSAGKLKVLESAPLLVHQLGDDFYGARMSAAEALLKFDSVYIVELLADSLQSENDFVKSLGCYLMGQIGSDKAIEILYELIQTSDEKTETEAALALIDADPDDLCGYQNVILQKVSNRLSLLKIESAIQAAQNEKEESQK